MSNFQISQQKAKKLTPKKVETDLFNFIRTLEKELADINVDTLFNLSQDVEGNPIGFYSQGTEAITEGRKKAGDPFDLFETGEFLERLFAKVDRNSIFFDTKDPKKTEVLRNLLSTNIFGLSDEDLNKVISKHIQPFMITYFRKNLI